MDCYRGLNRFLWIAAFTIAALTLTIDSHAQNNPCAAKNPCAANPCAAKANPCAGGNPCAPGGRSGGGKAITAVGKVTKVDANAKHLTLRSNGRLLKLALNKHLVVRDGAEKKLFQP